jgi:hypothetical protein
MNTGIIIEKKKQDWYTSGETGILYKEIVSDWTPYLPVYEAQQTNLIATQACVSFSCTNVIETQLKQQGIDINISDRFLAKMSGTTGNGNTLQAVLDSIRNDGWLLEEDYPFVNNWDEYYQEIPQELKDKAKKNLADATWQINYEWVNYGDCRPNLEALKIQLKQSPLQRIASFGSGLCNTEHATMLYKIDDTGIYIFDSYDGGIKKLPLDYPMPYLMKIVVTPKVETQFCMIPPVTKDLWLGDTNTEVKYLQQKLIKLGYLSKGLATGYYGPLTKSAVYQFQLVNKVASLPILWWNGGKYVGLATRKFLNLL